MSEKVIAETNNFIILDSFTAHNRMGEYQTEDQLERRLIDDLVGQGYQYRKDITSSEALFSNARELIERLNTIHFSDSEWERFLLEYLDSPSDSVIDRIEKIQHNHRYDFRFDDGRIQNISLIDKKDLSRNMLQVINQFEQTGTHANRYDVSILINGLPLVHIELKRRGCAIREAFNQIHRYSKESFNSAHSLYKYVQLFVISNGTDTRYFANTTKRDKSSFDFTMNWARSNNEPIKDLEDFTATFFERRTLLQVLVRYSVFDTRQLLLVMRPYQIAATERILWKIRSSYNSKIWGKSDAGGYIWHTTGSGKTLTSFKAAQLATELDFIDKVFFVVDRKDLDDQTMREYKRFDPDSVMGSTSTHRLKENIESFDKRIIVTTIQKLNRLLKKYDKLDVYGKQVVFIFDECHRSQFGEAQKNIKRKFKKYYQFGFTGTPIFNENSVGAETTASVFGRELHSYVITDAIRDEKVLKFKVDYHSVAAKFRSCEAYLDETSDSDQQSQEALLESPQRIEQVVSYILRNFGRKTHRNSMGEGGFNAMLAVSSIDTARLYYKEFQRQQEGVERGLRVATIFSYSPNETQDSYREGDEPLETSGLSQSSKEFLVDAIADYNAMFRTNFSVDGDNFQNYYSDISVRMKNDSGAPAERIDLLIVVGMFLTGFDAPKLNTLFVDKKLKYHGLLQAYSRTNRIYDSTKTFGNIVAFRDLEQATIDAIRLFGDANKRDVILERRYEDYLEGYEDEQGIWHDGYLAVSKQLSELYPDPHAIVLESEKKNFVKLFGSYLKLEHVLYNYDEFYELKSARAKLDAALVAPDEVGEQAPSYDLTTEGSEHLSVVLQDRAIQNYKSTYNDIRQKIADVNRNKKKHEQAIWDDVVFEVELLKSQEINLEYILGLIFEHYAKTKDKRRTADEISRVIRASLEQRAKEELVVSFIEQADLSLVPDKEQLIADFFSFAQAERDKELKALIEDEKLKEAETKRYIEISLKREYASDNGTDLADLMPPMSPMRRDSVEKKQNIFARLSSFVEKYKGVGSILGL